MSVLPRTVLVLNQKSQETSLSTGFVKTSRKLECAVGVRIASLERRRSGGSFRTSSICTRGRRQGGRFGSGRWGHPDTPQAMLLRGTACPRATPAAQVQVAVLRAAHTRAHFLPSLVHVHPGARITLQPLPCILHPEARGASALGPCRGNASLLLYFWVLDHLAVFTLGIPAVRESLLGKGARTGLHCKGWASCWSDGLTHRAWYSQSPVFSVLSLHGTRLHTGTIPAASRPAGTREPGVSLYFALLCPAG